MSALRQWTINDSRDLYNLSGWSLGYFDINAKGHLAMHPRPGGAKGLDLMELLADAQRMGLSLPLLIRFSDILRDRLDNMRQAFDEAMGQAGYQGGYLPVYPIKVNQQCQVVEQVVQFGHENSIGLEAGSKSELYAVLALQEAEEALIICNGYKDASYIRLALLSQKLGKKVFLVVEKPAELELMLKVARQEGIKPTIGIRVKLVATGSGKWEASGGDFSKFGLTPAELVEAVDRLQEEGYLDCFRLIHFHIGSQITNIRRIKEALREMARYYAELRKMGCSVDHVDVGGGLGVDYDGSKSSHDSSVNYSLTEYANDVVYMLEEVCRLEELPHPTIITESGRAITAHHAMLAVNIFESVSMAPGPLEPFVAGDREDDPGIQPLINLQTVYDELNHKNLLESWHDAMHLREECNRNFEMGVLSLRDRATAQSLFWAIARKVDRLGQDLKRPPEEMAALSNLLADKYFCNFSVFQSLPDAWAVDQQFPIMPLHRLKEKPSRRAILTDITCDSDGKIDNFISHGQRATTLPLHPLEPGQPYYLGFFLTGAYQEILGDLHNLFGDTNAIHVSLKPDGSWSYDQVVRGEKVADVLEYVNFQPEVLTQAVERQVKAGVEKKLMTPEEGQALLQLYRDGMESYTYLVEGEE